MERKYFLHELSSLPNHELTGVSVSMWLKHQFETKIVINHCSAGIPNPRSGNGSKGQTGTPKMG
eukprot:10520628-Ditylum_brightwellii.AAC.1